MDRSYRKLSKRISFQSTRLLKNQHGYVLNMRFIMKFLITLFLLSCFSIEARLDEQGRTRQQRMRISEKRKPFYPFVTGDAFRDYATYVYDTLDTNFEPERVEKGDIVFVDTYRLQKFLQLYHKKIKHEYILITHNSDLGITNRYINLINDPKIIAWFSTNVMMNHKKLIPIPIGLQNRYTLKGDHNVIQKYINEKDQYEKDYFVYVNFAINTNRKVRQKAYDYFSQKAFSTVIERTEYQENLKNTLRSQFVISPPGNGLDCHRTWEAVHLGAIPVVLSSQMDSAFDDLPIIIVSDWKQVTPEYLKKKSQEFSKKEFNFDKMYIDYWLNLISSHRKKYLEK